MDRKFSVKFDVSVPATMAITVYADSEESAKDIAQELVKGRQFTSPNQATFEFFQYDYDLADKDPKSLTEITLATPA